MLKPDTKLGPYEIVAPIGAGGMGEVYRARDTQLGRQVAIKVLPEDFAHDIERMARFQREAKLLAALNHPNIATIHGLEDSGSTRALVMELAEGPTLADRIRQGPIPVEDAIPIARQMADALEYAHEHGIVHRDLKPANVKVAGDDTVKILDFGLAKAMETELSAKDSANSPTLSHLATQAGVLLGTAAYMSPEQAKAKTVDRRADIWAFGCVLYEMLTGNMAFHGDAVTETLAAVIKNEPDWSQLPAETPMRVRVLLQRCLQKDPKQRLRDMGDARISLDEVLSGAPEGSPAPYTAEPSWRRIVPWAATLVLGVLAAVALWSPWREPQKEPQLVTFNIFPPTGTILQKFAVSPDGLKVAYFASGNKGGGLWARSLDDLTPARIAGNFDVVSIPSFFWSADSRFVAFSGGNDFHRLMVADSAGGPPETLAEMNVRVAGGSWSRDGTILFGSMTPGIWRISAAGGEPVQITANDPSHPSLGHFSPILLPDAKHFLYFVLFGQSSADSGIFVGSMDTKPVEQSRERIVATNTAATFVSTPDPRTGYLLFIRDDALLAQTLDLSTLQLTGTPTRIASGVGGELEFGGFSASTDGVLAYRITPSRGINLIKPTWFDRKGERTGTLTNLNAIELGGIALSPDGTRAAVSRTDPNKAGQQDIWLLDFARNDALLRLTSGTALHFDPVWSPDGKQIAYVSTSKQGAALSKRPSSGSGTEEVVLQANGKERHLNHWSPDGRFLLFTEQNETTDSDIWIVPVDGERKPEVFLNSEFNETQGQFSPDGHWIAYVSNETGEPQVYIQPFPRGTGSGEKISVSGDVGVMPRWRRDGQELFYVRVRGGNRIMAADFSTTPSAAAGIPHGLFTVPIMGTNAQLFLWDVAPSGDRFFLSALPEIKESDAPLTVVLNWQRMLEK